MSSPGILTEVDIKQTHGDDNFRFTLIDSYQKTLELYDENPNINPIETPYYEVIVNNYTRKGLPWFGYTNEEGIAQRTRDFLSLYSDIKRRYDPENHGYIECIPQKDGKLKIDDGHHRLTILRRLGYKTVHVLVKQPNGGGTSR